MPLFAALSITQVIPNRNNRENVSSGETINRQTANSKKQGKR